VDAEGFHLLAVNLLDGNGFAIGWEPPFCPTAVRTPLYPLFLAGIYALVGRLPEGIVPFHILLEVLTTALVMALARELWRLVCGSRETFGVFLSSRRRLDGEPPEVFLIATGGGSSVAMLMAGLLYALNGTTQRFAGYLFSETFLLPLLSLALLLTLRSLRSFRSLRPRWRSTLAGVVIAGLSWALVLLTKPNEQYLALAAGLVLTWGAWSMGRRQQEARLSVPLRQSALAVVVALWAAFGLTLAPWLARNRLVLGRWMLSTAFEENVARVSAVVTEAALRGVVAEPWTTTWEAIYDDLEARAVPDLAGVPDDWPGVPCEVRTVWKHRIARVAREVVLGDLGTYVRVHLRGVARGWLDPGHRLWYRVLTGRDWATTGVVPSIGQRMAWSLERGAVGDALAAFWSQRVARIPRLAGLLWWALIAARAVVGFLVLRGLWRLRRHPLVALLLAGAIAYHILLPGPIAHDRFYVPLVPVIVALVAVAWAYRPGS
jgi:hypothetical protein